MDYLGPANRNYYRHLIAAVNIFDDRDRQFANDYSSTITGQVDARPVWQKKATVVCAWPS
jgi:hypothetical protein